MDCFLCKKVNTREGKKGACRNKNGTDEYGAFSFGFNFATLVLVNLRMFAKLNVLN